MNSKLKFITFASHGNYILGGERLIKQVSSLNIFSETFLYTAEDLKRDQYFWSKHGDFINNNRRGYGYWVWKPYIIKETMKKMSDGDILLYLDCGCEVDVVEKADLLECIQLVKNDKLVGIFTLLEKDWNKMDLILKLDANKDIYLNTRQHAAGANLWLVCNETRHLLNEWYDLACDYHNIDDTPSISPNLEDFRQHRHDQSIFSLLTKKRNLFSIRDLRGKCIKTLRNKSDISRLTNNVSPGNTNNNKDNLSQLLKNVIPQISFDNKLTINENNQTVLSDNKPTIKENNPTVLSDNKPTIKENNPTVLSDNKPTIKENNPTVLSDNKLTIKENNPTVLSDNKPTIKENNPTVLSDNKSKIKENNPTVLSDNKSKYKIKSNINLSKLERKLI